MIYNEMNEISFAHELSSNKDNGFSYEGAKALYEYLDNSDIDFEFDAVALRCDFSEVDAGELVQDYGVEFSDEGLDDDEKLEEAIEYISDRTTLIEVDDDTYIIQNF